MTNNARVSDAQVRRLAATTFDRNVVVIAGAGTGKTTLLVNRLVHTLMREPDPVPVTSLVALTFTNKAATEMKTRLRERLTLLSEAVRLEERPAGTAGVVASELYESYGLSLDQIHRRAEAALRDLEKAQIGTLHSFAAHLLRLHPIESGIDPAFREDDGSRLDELFAVEWELWLSRELGPEGVDHDRWRGLLEAIGLPAIHDMARALCGELIELEELNRQVMSTGIATLGLPSGSTKLVSSD